MGQSHKCCDCVANTRFSSQQIPIIPKALVESEGLPSRIIRSQSGKSKEKLEVIRSVFRLRHLSTKSS